MGVWLKLLAPSTKGSDQRRNNQQYNNKNRGYSQQRYWCKPCNVQNIKFLDNIRYNWRLNPSRKYYVRYNSYGERSSS